MTPTIDLAKEAGFADWYGTDDIAFLALLDIFRALCVAERDRELIGVGMEPVAYRYTEEVSSGAYSEPVLEKRVSLNRYFATYKDAEKLYTATQLAAARLHGAEAERDAEWKFKCEVIAKAQDQIQRIAELEADLEKHRALVVVHLAKFDELEQQLAEKRAELKSHCACTFDGDVNTEKCKLHGAWHDTLHEQAEYRRERDALQSERDTLASLAKHDRTLISEAIRTQTEYTLIIVQDGYKLMKLGQAVAQKAQLAEKREPEISTDHGPWIASTASGEEGETHCQRCLLRFKFLGSRGCEPHIVEAAHNLGGKHD